MTTETARLNFHKDGDVTCDDVLIGRIDAEGDWQPEDECGWTELQVERDLNLQMDDGTIDFEWQPEHFIFTGRG